MLNRALWIVLLMGAGGYVVVCVAAVLFQERLVFFPGLPPVKSPSDFGLEYRTAEFAAADGVTLQGWFLPASASDRAVLVSHGNAGSIEHRIALAQAFVELGYSVLLYDYRGYGQSHGRPTEAGTYLDAEAAWDWLVAQPEVNPERVALYGESLGGAVAIELAKRRPAAALVVESGFTSISDMGAEAYPWLPVRLLTRIQYDNLAKIGSLSLPLLVAHSAGDHLVPLAHGEALFARANEPKTWLETSGGHNDGGFLRSAEHTDVVAAFLSDALR